MRKLESEPNVKGTAFPIQLDVTDDKSVDAAAKMVAAKYGCLDILVNNAGIGLLVNPPSRVKYCDVLNTNVVGSLSMTEAFLDLLCKSDEHHLIFVSSSVG